MTTILVLIVLSASLHSRAGDFITNTKVEQQMSDDQTKVLKTSDHSNRFRRRRQKQLAERTIGGKLTPNRKIDLAPGARIPVKVRTPHTDQAGNTKIVELFALLVVENDGRTRLEALPGYEFKRPGEPEYHATVDLPECPDWQVISNLPVQISRHTQRVVYTKLVIERLEQFGPESRL